MEEMQKKIGRTMGVLMGLTMSISMITVGNVIAAVKSGHFNIISYGIGLVVGIILSLILGRFISIKKISDAINNKVGANPTKLPGRIIQALVSTLIFTPLLCFVGVYIGTTLAGAQIDKAVEGLKTEIVQTQEELKNIDPTNMAAVGPLQGKIASQTAKVAELEQSKPPLLPSYLFSLVVSLGVSFVLSFVLAPIYQKLVFKHYKIG